MRSQRKDPGVIKYSRRALIILIGCVSALAVLTGTLAGVIVSRQMRQPTVVSAARATVSPEVHTTAEPPITAMSTTATADTTTEAAADTTTDVDAATTTPANEAGMAVSDAIRAAALADVPTPSPTPAASRATPVARASGTQAQARAVAPTPTRVSRTSASSTYPTLRRGSTGDAVRAVQQIMNYYSQCRSLPVAKLTVDGIYGPLTEGAVRAFQQQHGLPVDGIVGPTMWQLLRQDLANLGQQSSC